MRIFLLTFLSLFLLSTSNLHYASGGGPKGPSDAEKRARREAEKRKREEEEKKREAEERAKKAREAAERAKREAEKKAKEKARKAAERAKREAEKKAREKAKRINNKKKKAKRNSKKKLKNFLKKKEKSKKKKAKSNKNYESVDTTPTVLTKEFRPSLDLKLLEMLSDFQTEFEDFALTAAMREYYVAELRTHNEEQDQYWDAYFMLNDDGSDKGLYSEFLSDKQSVHTLGDKINRHLWSKSKISPKKFKVNGKTSTYDASKIFYKYINLIVDKIDPSAFSYVNGSDGLPAFDIPKTRNVISVKQDFKLYKSAKQKKDEENALRERIGRPGGGIRIRPGRPMPPKMHRKKPRRGF